MRVDKVGKGDITRGEGYENKGGKGERKVRGR